MPSPGELLGSRHPPIRPRIRTDLLAFGGEHGGRRFGGVAAPSANKFGRVSPTLAEHVFADFALAVPLILDGGATNVGIESTIVDLSGEPESVLALYGPDVKKPGTCAYNCLLARRLAERDVRCIQV